jgi:hypothetical protein
MIAPMQSRISFADKSCPRITCSTAGRRVGCMEPDLLAGAVVGSLLFPDGKIGMNQSDREDSKLHASIGQL